MKNFSIVVIDYSFEPVEGVLAIISPNGKICLFNLYQPKGSKLYQSFVFTIKLETSLARSVSTGAKGNNLVKFVNSKITYFQCTMDKAQKEDFFFKKAWPQKK